MLMQAWNRLIQKHRLAVFIVIFGIFIRLPLTFLPLNYMSYPWRFTDTASIAHNFVDNGYHLFYPQINWGGAGPGYVETEFQLYPFIIALLYGVFGEHVWLGKLVSLVFSALTFIMFYALARRLFKPRVALWALAFFIITPMGLLYGVEFMPEATVLFFYVTALYLFQRWLDNEKLQTLLLAGVITALAILVKPTSIHIGFIFLFLLLERFRLRTFAKWRIWLFAAIALIPSVLWYWHARDLYLAYGNTFGVISGGDSKFGNLFSYWFSPGFYESLINIDIRRIFSGVGVLLFVLGMIVYIRTRTSSLLLFGVVAVFVYYMIIPRYTSFADYYHIYLVPFAALGVGVGTDWLFTYAKDMLPFWNGLRYSPMLVGVIVLLFILGNVVRFYRGLFTPYAQELITCAHYVSARVPENERVIISTNSFAVETGGIANNYQDPIIFFVSHRYGWSLPADDYTPTRIEQFWKEGASYFVVYDAVIYRSYPDVAKFLEENSDQIGPGIDSGCGIYKFRGSFG